jgi:hypothetical protein
MTDSWVEQHMPQLESRIKTICLNDKSLQCVFVNKWSFPNLQLINLQGDEWNMSLRLKNKSALIVLMSSLNLFHEIDPFTQTSSIDTKNYVINVSEKLHNPYILFMNEISG